MTLTDRVYPIHLIIIIVPSKEKECCCCFSSILIIYKDIVECIDKDAKLVLNNANGETYSSYNQLQHKNHMIKRG